MNSHVALPSIVFVTASFGALCPVHAVTWADRCADVKIVCVEILVAPADPATPNRRRVTFTPDPVFVKKPSTRVFWQLPHGYVFNHAAASVSIPHVGEISDASGVDEDAGDLGQLTRRYKVRARELRQDYKYTVSFHEMNGGMPTKRISCDPTIANFGGGIMRGPRQKTEGKVAVAKTDLTVDCAVRDEP